MDGSPRGEITLFLSTGGIFTPARQSVLKPFNDPSSEAAKELR